MKLKQKNNVGGWIFLICLLAISQVSFSQNLNTPNKMGPLGTQVNTFSGNLYIPRSDIYILSRGFDISVNFYYNTFNFTENKGFGNGWGFRYGVKYRTDSADSKTIIWGDGREDNYELQSGGSYKPPKGFFTTFVQYQTNKFRLTEKEGIKYFFDNPTHKRITRVEDPNGNFLNFGYADTLLTTITSSNGQVLNLTYNATGRLSSIIDAIASPTRTWTYSYDGNGNLTQVTDPLGGKMKYAYLINGPMKAMWDKNDNSVDIIYYTDYTISEIIGCNKRIGCSYDFDQQKTVVTDFIKDGVNQVTTYGYKSFDKQIWLTSLTGNCCGFNLKFDFDDAGNKIRETDANGNITSFTYDEKGNMLTMTDPLNQKMTYAYSADYNKLTRIEDAKGFVTTMNYNSAGNLTQLIEPGNLVYTASYNPNGDIISSTDPKGNVYNYNYDAFGNPTTMTGPDGYNITLGFDARGYLMSFADAKGNAGSMERDILSRLKKVTDPINNSLQFTYDAEGNTITLKNQNNETSNFAYDASNRIVKVTDEMKYKSFITYDAMNNITGIKNPLGNEVKFKFDALNRLVSATDAIGNNTSLNYDAKGNVTSLQAPNGQQITYTYDQNDRVSSINDLNGLIANLTFDKNNLVTSFTRGTGATYNIAYDSLNRVKQMTDPLGFSVYIAYDKNSNVLSITDRNGNVRSNTFDNNNRLKTYTDNNGFTVTISYDVDGNVTSVKDQKNNTTTYGYDALNRLTNITYPDSKFIQFTYDAKGNIVTKKLTDGTTINFGYDSLNRMVTKSLPDGNVYTYGYDAIGRIISATNNAGTVLLTYDALNRVTSETFDGRLTQYAYNTAGRTQTIIYPDLTVITKNFDTRNRLISIKKGNNDILTFQYNNADQVISKNFANGVGTSMQYDFANRLAEYTTAGGVIQHTALTYDKERNRLSITRLNNPLLSEQFTYDNGYRITNYKRGVSGSPTVQNTYAFDAVGNRTSANLNGINTTYAANNLNQLTSSNSSAQNINFTYDNNGNLTFDGSFYKRYDAEGKLLKDSSSVSNIITYQYDAFGRRVQKSLNGTSLKYAYAGASQIEERNGATNALRNRTVFVNFYTPVLNENNNNSYYYHLNDLNSVEAITNNTGSLVERYQYDLYGKPTIYNASNTVIPGSITGNRFGFTGQEYDSANGQYHFMYRNYSPTTGTFNQRDLIGYTDGMGMYQYVHNDPANGIDVFGLADCPPKRALDEVETDASWANGIGSWLDVTTHRNWTKQMIALLKYQHDLEVMTEILENQWMGKEASVLWKQWEKTTAQITQMNASKMGKWANGLGKVGMGLNLLDFGIKSYKFGEALNTGDGYQITKAGGNMAQSGLGFTPVGAAYNLFDFTQEKVTSALTGGNGQSMNDNAEYAGLYYGDAFWSRVDHISSYDDQAYRDHWENGDAARWLAAERKMQLKILQHRSQPPKSDCPQNGPDGGTRKPTPYPPGFVGPIKPVEILLSGDPNEIIGPEGVPDKRWVSINDRLPYTILFENELAATAPAKYVKVEYTIPAKQDPNTFFLGSFGFNNQTFTVTANTASYYQRLNCKDSLGLYIDVTAGLDVINNKAFWEFQSIDPVTLLPPSDPLKGVLLLQDPAMGNNGHAFLNFSIKPIGTAHTLDSILATAKIVFDTNDTIPTNVAKNTIDALPPTSHLNALPATSFNFVNLAWSGVDDAGGSGVRSYTLYVSTDGINFTIIRSGITRTDTTFKGTANTNYCFFVLATDRVGNTEVLRPGEIRCTFIGSAPLPITWLYFRGRNEDKTNVLEWATTTEINSKDFRLERSLDGTTFTEIAILPGKGSSSVTNYYDYRDQNIDRLNASVMYYRVKQVDLNGNFRYSSVVRLNYNVRSAPVSMVYPNPTHSVINLVVGDASLVGTQLRLYDINGRLVEVIKLKSSNQAINMDKYMNGVYIIRLSNNEAIRIIKE